MAGEFWLKGALKDAFDGAPSERKTGLLEDMLDGGGYGARGETGGLIGFMERMFGQGGSEKKRRPNGMQSGLPGSTMAPPPVSRPKSPPQGVKEYYDALGLGDQPGGQTTYYDGMGMDYGTGRLQLPQMGSAAAAATPSVPGSGGGSINPANAYQKAPEAMRYSGRGNFDRYREPMPAQPVNPADYARPDDPIMQYLRSIGAL